MMEMESNSLTHQISRNLSQTSRFSVTLLRLPLCRFQYGRPINGWNVPLFTTEAAAAAAAVEPDSALLLLMHWPATSSRPPFFGEIIAKCKFGVIRMGCDDDSVYGELTQLAHNVQRLFQLFHSIAQIANRFHRLERVLLNFLLQLGHAVVSP